MNIVRFEMQKQKRGGGYFQIGKKTLLIEVIIIVAWTVQNTIDALNWTHQ